MLITGQKYGDMYIGTTVVLYCTVVSDLLNLLKIRNINECKFMTCSKYNLVLSKI